MHVQGLIFKSWMVRAQIVQITLILIQADMSVRAIHVCLFLKFWGKMEHAQTVLITLMQIAQV